MFWLEYNQDRNVLLVTFGGTVTRQVHQDMVVAVRRFVDRHGPCDAIVDFGAAREFQLDLKYVRTVAQARAVLFGQRRVLVAPSDEVFGMMRLFEAHQSGTGDSPVVMRTLAEALNYLGAVATDFRPVPTDQH